MAMLFMILFAIRYWYDFWAMYVVRSACKSIDLRLENEYLIGEAQGQNQEKNEPKYIEEMPKPDGHV